MARKKGSSYVGTYSVKTGKAGEQIAATQLKLAGLEMVEKIYTGFIPGTAVPIERVSGDLRAVVPGTGQSVLVEVKARDRNLRYSDFRKGEPLKGIRGQIENLELHHSLGGLSIVAYVYYGRCFLLQWPIPGLVPNKSIKPETAERLAVDYFT